MQLLNRVQKVAEVAHRLQLGIWALGFLSFAFFAYIIFASRADLDGLILPSAVAFGWSICLLGIASSFREIPEHPKQIKGFFRRIGFRIKYGIAWFWAAIFSLCTLILIYMSVRSIFIYLGT